MLATGLAVSLAAADLVDPSPRATDGLRLDQPILAVMTVRAPLQARYRIGLAYDLTHPWHADLPADLSLVYNQTSVWDLNETSRPFRDSSYMPAIAVNNHRPEDRWRLDDGATLWAEAGLRHESNGRSGIASRSIGLLYLRPSLRLERAGWAWTISPEAHAYMKRGDNPDLPRYRGYIDLDTAIEVPWRELRLDAFVRHGTRPGIWTLHLGASAPLPILSTGGSPYLQALWVSGYGPTFLEYRDRPGSRLSLGIALVR
jgi:outer membrane phospholipase A